MRAEVSTLFGLNVYTDKGVYVGKVNDVILDPNESRISGLAVGKINPELFDLTQKGVILPYRWVIASGDIIIIKQMIRKLRSEDREAEKEYN
ncbi:MAG: PRC-barrel domain-containing protein [ANME-2 cluster archaeon]|nr:PRC-barrel domain-containing protein [ANME-2 cluster archaeon]